MSLTDLRFKFISTPSGCRHLTQDSCIYVALQVDAETSASLDRYYSLPATLSLPPTVSLDAPLLQSRTSLLPGAWASGAFGDALDEFFLDSPTMLDSPVLNLTSLAAALDSGESCCRNR